MDKIRFAMVMTAAVVALAVGEAMIARGMRKAGAASSGFWGDARAAVTSGWVVGGVVVLGVHLGLYATALALADLSLAMPLTAASYPLGVALARVFLHEEVNAARWVGTAVITAGVALVAWGEARTSP